MVQLPATAAIEYVAACCITRTRTITKTKTKTKTRTKIRTKTKTRTRTKTGTKTKIGTITEIVLGPYVRSPQVQYVYAPSGLSVPSVVAWRTNKKTYHIISYALLWHPTKRRWNYKHYKIQWLMLYTQCRGLHMRWFSICLYVTFLW